MARPLRIEFAGALYHLTSRGNERKNIYLGDGDRDIFLRVLSQTCERYNWVCYSYCLMNNHYHLLIETPEGNLSQGMRHLNGVYTQRFNRIHERVGHIFQGRYKAILVQKESYLLELCRYIALNPVRAEMVWDASEWRWSSHRATVGVVSAPEWLEVNWLLSLFDKSKRTAVKKYRSFVSEGKNLPSPWKLLKNQIYLGDEAFVDNMQCRMLPDVNLDEVPSRQKRQLSKPLIHYASLPLPRNENIYRAYLGGGYSMKAIANHFELHYSSVSKIIKNHENSNFKT